MSDNLKNDTGESRILLYLLRVDIIHCVRYSRNIKLTHLYTYEEFNEIIASNLLFKVS